MSSRVDPEIKSVSPSPSKSAAKIDLAPLTLVVISVAVKVGFALPSFSYQAIVLSFSEAETMSKKPSLFKSATKTPLTKSASVAISEAVKVGSDAPSFSYQAIVSSFAEAETISISPSLSMSAR